MNHSVTSKKISHTILTGLFLSAALACGQTPAPAATKAYQIAQGDLAQALNQFAQASNVAIAFSPQLTRSKTTPGLSGQYTPLEGLRQLLRGSQLDIIPSNGGYALQARPADEAGSGNLDDVVVIGRPVSKQEALYRQSGGHVYLSETDLNRFARTSPADILNGIAGVETGGSRNGGALDVNVRGIQGMGRVAVTVDGAQQSLETYRGYGGTQNRSYIPADLISSVQVEKGPSTKAGTGGAIGGVVAMNTIGVQDILTKGADTGLRLTGGMWSNSVDPSHAGRNEHLTAARAQPGGLNDLPARSGSLAFAHRSERFDFVAAYAKQNQGNYYAGKKGADRYPQLQSVYGPGDEVMNTSNRNESVLLKTTLRPSDEQSLALGYRYYDGEFGEIMGSALYRGNGDRIPQWPIGNMKIDAYTAHYEYLSADHTWLDLKANLWLTQAKNNQLNAGPVAPDSQQSDMNVDYRWSKLKNQRWGLDLSNDAVFDTQLGRFTWTLGGAYLEEDIRPNQVLITESDRHQNLHLRDAKRQEMSLLTQLQYQPNDRLTVEVGGRYTRFKNQDRNQLAHEQTVYENNPYRKVRLTLKTDRGYTETGYLQWFANDDGEYSPQNNPEALINQGLGDDLTVIDYGGPYTLAEFLKMLKAEIASIRIDTDEMPGTVSGYEYTYSAPLRYSGSEFAPFVGLRYQTTPNSHVYANYKEAVRVPGLFETTLGMAAGVPYINQDLRPERSKSWEVGAAAYRHDLLRAGDSANVRVAYFKNDIHDFLTRYYHKKLEMRNSDRYQVSGMELQLNYDAGRFFLDLAATKYFKAQTCDKEIAAILTKIDQYRDGPAPDCTEGGFTGSYVNTQNPPKLTTVLTAGARLLNERLTLGSRLTRTSGPLYNLNKPWQAQTTTIQLKYEPVTVVDVFANYEFKDNLSVNFSIDNLTNRYYLDPLAQTLMPAPGRNYKLGLSYKF